MPNPNKPLSEKTQGVLDYIQTHPGCSARAAMQAVGLSGGSIPPTLIYRDLVREERVGGDYDYSLRLYAL